jgi:hypothetical protein
MTDNRSEIRALIRGAYDLQKLRIETGNRLVANFKTKLGQAPSSPEETLDAEAQAILDSLRDSYKKLTDGLSTFPRYKDFKGDEIISSYAELSLSALYFSMEEDEKNLFNRTGRVIESHPLWPAFLHGVKGCGQQMSGILISEINIHVARYPSSLWAYAGLDVAPDGAGRSKRSEHLIDREYTKKNGELTTRKSITYNPWLKTKLIGVLAPSFLKQTPDRSPYAAIYYDYKNRLENHTKYGTHNNGKRDEDGKFITSDGRRHAMSLRYTIKIFLIHLHTAWRDLEGYEPTTPYHEAKLGMRHTA